MNSLTAWACLLDQQNGLVLARGKIQLPQPLNGIIAVFVAGIRITVSNSSFTLKYLFHLVSKADVLVPPGLVINTSTIPNAGHGIFARCEIPKHEFFGPYIGKIIDSKDAQNYEDSPYIWEV